MPNSARFCYSFPAIRGIQASREYYVSMCPLKLIPKLFHFDDNEVEPELRAQRVLNKNRIPSIANYIVENKDNYTFSAITASIDGNVEFKPQSEEQNDLISLRMGVLTIPMDANFIINDGQHRRAAIEEALKRVPELGEETIAVVFFVDRGLARCQQMFADLNRYAIRPSASIGVLYDIRDKLGSISKFVALKNYVFSSRIEMEKSSIAPRSRKLFTLSALNFATKELLADNVLDEYETARSLALSFWNEVAKNIPGWTLLNEERITAGDLREKYVHAHSVLLQALGRMGRELIKTHPDNWSMKLRRLQNIDWSRSNARDWEGRAMVNGRMSKNAMNVALCSNKLKTFLGLPLSSEEKALESNFRKNKK